MNSGVDAVYAAGGFALFMLTLLIAYLLVRSMQAGDELDVMLRRRPKTPARPSPRFGGSR